MSPQAYNYQLWQTNGVSECIFKTISNPCLQDDAIYLNFRKKKYSLPEDSLLFFCICSFLLNYLFSKSLSSFISMICNTEHYLYGSVTPAIPVQLLSGVEILNLGQWTFVKFTVAFWGLIVLLEIVCNVCGPCSFYWREFL